MTWEKYFEKKYLRKGLKFYRNNKVHDIEFDYDRITSKVIGAYDYDYDVEIIFNEGKIESMDCVCSYTQSDRCEHMAATLYKYEEILDNTTRSLELEVPNPEKEFKNTLDNIDEKTLKKYIHKKFKKDKEFIEEFLNKFKSEPTMDDFEKYENMLNNMFDSDFLKSNYDNLYKNGSLNTVLYDFMNNKLEELLKNKQYDYAQKLINIIYEKIAKLEDANKYIDIHGILIDCNSCLDVIINNQDSKQKDETYNYLMENLRYNYNIYTSQHIVELCSVCYATKEYQKNTLDVINKVIEENDKIPVNIHEAKTDLMLNLNYSYKDIKQEVFEYRDYSLIKYTLVEAGLRDEEYDEVIKLMEEPSEPMWLMDRIKNTTILIDLYEIIGNIEKCKEKIKKVLFEFRITDIDYINQLKELSTKDEWEEELSNLIDYYQRKREFDFINEIYIYYHRYEDLYNNILDNCSIEDLEEYKQYYQEEHGDEILDIYKKKVLKNQEMARSRKAYNTIIDYLNTMLTYNNSEETVRELIHTMKNNKKNKGKKLFLEELEKFENTLNL